MINLTPEERRALRARAHQLHPIAMIGAAGVTAAVLREIDRALRHHELIKIRMLGDRRAERAAAIGTICEAMDAAPVQVIGKILVVYRPRPEPEAAPVTAAPPRTRPAKDAARKPRRRATR